MANRKWMAHIVEGKVVNVSLWDGESEWNPSEEVIELPTREYTHSKTGEIRIQVLAGVDWDYVDGEFVDNRPRLTDDDEPSEPKEEGEV